MTTQEPNNSSKPKNSHLGQERALAEKGLITSDKYIEFLTKGFDSVSKHGGKILIGFTAIVLVAAGFGVASSISKNKERALGDQLALIEERLNKKKEEFSKLESEYRQALNQPKDAKVKVAIPPEPKKDFESDYSGLVAELKAFVAGAPRSKAAQRAALEASIVLTEFNKTQEALEILNMVKAEASGFLDGLIQNKVGLMLVAENKCDEAIQSWDQVLKNKDVMFLHSQAHYQQGLCYLEKKDFTQAENLLMKAKAVQDSSVASAADRALRVLAIEKQQL